MARLIRASDPTNQIPNLLLYWGGAGWYSEEIFGDSLIVRFICRTSIHTPAVDGAAVYHYDDIQTALGHYERIPYYGRHSLRQ